MTPEGLGIGIIGAGHIVERHLAAYRSLSDLARIVAVADIDLNRAEAAQRKAGAQFAFDDHRRLLERSDIGAVDVCTPANFHAPVVIDALQAGKHVLCEKPMATTLADADAILKEAQRNPKLAVNFVFQLRAEATHRRMRELIRNGEIGRPLVSSLNVRLRKKAAYFKSGVGRGTWKVDGGGVLINQAIHQLDALLSFLGDAIEASAVMHTFIQPTETEDTLAGWVRFAGGALATIECTTCAHGKHFAIDVLGENASMRIAGDPDGHAFDWQVKAPCATARNAIVNKGLKLVPPPSSLQNPLASGFAKLAAKIRGKQWMPPDHWGHTPFIRAFLEAIRGGNPGPVPVCEARRSLELCAALYESALHRRVVSLPLDSSSSVYNGVKTEKMELQSRSHRVVAGIAASS